MSTNDDAAAEQASRRAFDRLGAEARAIWPASVTSLDVEPSGAVVLMVRDSHERTVLAVVTFACGCTAAFAGDNKVEPRPHAGARHRVAHAIDLAIQEIARHIASRSMATIGAPS